MDKSKKLTKKEEKKITVGVDLIIESVKQMIASCKEKNGFISTLEIRNALENMTLPLKVRNLTKEKKEKKEDGVSEKRKHPISAYVYFCNDHREQVRDENPLLKHQEIFRELAKKWKSLTDEEKTPWEKKASVDRKRFEMDKKTEVNKPKRTRSAWIFFMGDRRNSIIKKHPGIKGSEVLQKLSVIWKGMTDEQKKPWTEKSQADKVRYAESKESKDSKDSKETTVPKIKLQKQERVSQEDFEEIPDTSEESDDDLSNDENQKPIPVKKILKPKYDSDSDDELLGGMSKYIAQRQSEFAKLKKKIAPIERDKQIREEWLKMTPKQRSVYD